MGRRFLRTVAPSISVISRLAVLPARLPTLVLRRPTEVTAKCQNAPSAAACERLSSLKLAAANGESSDGSHFGHIFPSIKFGVTTVPVEMISCGGFASRCR
jgi:hypothetical protein